VMLGYWLSSETLSAPKLACSAALRPVSAAPVGLPPPSQACVFQVKLTRLLAAPLLNSMILRLSQALLTTASSRLCADQMMGAWISPVSTSISCAWTSPVHFCVV